MSFDYSLGEIAEYLSAELRGNPEVRITGLNTLQSAGPGELAFLANAKYQSQLQDCQAQAVLLVAAQADGYAGDCLVLDNPYLGYARLTAWFATEPKPQISIHPSAVIHPTAVIADEVSIGPNVVVEADAVIGRGSCLEANSFVGARTRIGERCRIGSNVSIYHDVIMGTQVRIHSGSVIGADGFGFAPDGQGGWQKIHQLGGVSIGNNVEIGACTTVDRGALEDTRIGNGVIIDNHVQIAHNVVIGDNTALAAYSGIAGSAVLGRNCILGGDACVVGHVTLCDNVMLTARTLVTKNITEPGSYSSGTTPLMKTAAWRKNSARIGQLDDMAKRLKTIEKKDNN
ncbi:MAG: UDP-3-O-(3-hydroxymyristoyl)glucosamine N-acyltransferase [Porticoccaceae bacterium]|jgi:UDP-3-O-[3-hydroxymyristoyl] glucosamine N-acyltransferase|nr:UDP-3-O-(3-hydroxymyristoyl)glucosamine N-acyltransferase [Porticoccaceae bacterium]MBT5577674.1 UDP-3-O-(3-hydroxymyristoyl)glucosamine N-acyltransferase [Porticoccaceae bacterium]MBT7376155.1 UDP-3-O-(3-hydroxymyristoyl)glucosamine N-acyltransferase [Porticoccaceae bacterium]